MVNLRTIAIAAGLLFAGSAHAADQPGYTGGPGLDTAGAACASDGVLRRIRGEFAHAERLTWRRGFVMERVENPRPNLHPYVEPGLIRRDYCIAEAVMTDGAIYTVYYAIEYGLGFVGLGRDVDYCVLGLDPWHVHDGSCRTVR